MGAKMTKNESSFGSESEPLETRIARLEFWALIFGIIVVVGVAGESVFGIRIWWNGRKLATVHKRESVVLQAEMVRLGNLTAEANARAADANARAAEAAKQAAGANARAAEAELQAERLRARFTRSLTPHQQDAIVALLKGLAGFAEVDVMETEYRDAEATMITGQIINVLQRSGWKTNRNIYDKHGDPLLGILVEFDPTSRGADNIANALVNALHSQGGLLITGPQSSPLRAQGAGGVTHWPIRITIGKR